MSTPEMPSQPSATPVASDAGASPVTSGEPATAATTNGQAGEVASANAEAAEHDTADATDATDAADADGNDTTEEVAQGEGTPAAGPGGEKKRRRRRRKKKPGAAPGAEAAAAGGASEGEPGEAPNGEVAAEGGTEEARTERKDKRKEKDKRHGPPRERPPVNIGDIVFGKITQITDEAIFVDIPGKARAIFDRRELLLADDEDHERSRAAGHAAAVEPAHAPATDAAPADGVSQDAAAEAPPTEPSEAPAETTTAEAAPNGEPEAAAPAEAAPPAETAEAEAAPPAAKDPKVPRVILEVGADFIAVVHNDGARGGLVVLTHHPHRSEKVKPLLEKALEDKTTTDGLVTGVIKGGIEVDVEGLRAFAPGSHVDLRMGADLSYLLGKRLPFYVSQYAKRGRDVVLSRKSLLEEEARRTRTEALAKLKVGEELDGVVRSVVPFGAFIDVGGVEGLVPLQEMSHNRADGPSDVFKAGEPTRVKVIKIDDRGKVWLSRKATVPDPWQQVAQKYAQGTRHLGKVVRLQPFGAFIELEPGVDGLIHTQDLSINRIEAPGEVVKVGEDLQVVVSHIDAGQHKIALHPAPQGDAANEAPQRVAPHKPVKAKIMAIESGGLVVRILGVTGRNARGYITSAATGTPRGTELRKAFKVGADVEAKVIEVDPRRGEVRLSIKALSEELERSAYQQYRQQLKAEARFTLADLLTKRK